jgi:membrane fusion protein, copper/silver efflux system
MKQKILIPVIAAIGGILIGYFVLGALLTSDGGAETAKEGEEVWYCSMHPQIRQPEPGVCPICFMDLIILDGKGGSDPLVFEMTPEAVKISNIQTTVIGGSTTSGELTLSGKIKADETTASSIVTHIPGRIEKLYVSFTGESVSKGKKIAKIYSPKLITAQRELLEAFKLKESNPGLLEAAKNKLRYWKISNAEINGIIKSQHTKEYFDIYADHSGIISKKKVSVGDYLGQGSVLFELQNLNKLWAVFDLYENDLQNVKKGDLIEFTTTSLPAEKFSSKITFIDPIINPRTRTAAVRLEITNSKNLLKPDMFITGKLKLTSSETQTSPLTVPKSAVLWTGERSVVYVKLPDLEMPSFEFNEVTLGESIGENFVVLEGLNSGDEVVTNGAFVIDASAQLNNQASMMNRSLLSGGEQSFKTPDFAISTPDAFKKQLENTMKFYLSIKDDLVKSNAVLTKSNSTKMMSTLKTVDMKLVSGQAHNYWMERSKELSVALEIMQGTENLDQQREAFDEVSNSMIKTAKAFGLYEAKYRVQYCPMANNDTGAYWISKKSEIRNPYFGDKMLKCGSVKDTIQMKKVHTTSDSKPKRHNH